MSHVAVSCDTVTEFVKHAVTIFASELERVSADRPAAVGDRRRRREQASQLHAYAEAALTAELSPPFAWADLDGRVRALRTACEAMLGWESEWDRVERPKLSIPTFVAEDYREEALELIERSREYFFALRQSAFDRACEALATMADAMRADQFRQREGAQTSRQHIPTVSTVGGKESPRKPGRPLDPKKAQVTEFLEKLRTDDVPWKDILERVRTTFGRSYSLATLQDYMKKARRGRKG